MLSGNFGFRLKYKSQTLLDALIRRYGGKGIYNLIGPKAEKGKHALVIYTAEALSKHLSKTLSGFSSMTSHSGFRESIEMLNLLLDMGYIVDYFDIKAPPHIDWSKYALVIDGGNSLQDSPFTAGQKKIYYSTSCHWRAFYENAYVRSDSFYRRNNLLLFPDREMKTNYSDEAADLITGFGGSYQVATFRENGHKMRQLKISTTCVPDAAFKKKIGSKNKFMWYAGHGPFHKGLDLVVEAFIQMPEKELHIFGNIELNKKLYAWFLTATEKSKNITYHGWATPDSTIFQEYAQLCDAVVYASSSEGGPGAIIQCMQFGLVPILNRFTAIDVPRNTFNITGTTPEEEIESIVRQVHTFSNTPAEELQQYSDELALHYSQNHTIERYVSSLKAVIEGN